MKKKALLLLSFVLIILVIVWGWGILPRSPGNTIQSGTRVIIPITMAQPSVSVDPDIQDATLQVLSQSAASRDVRLYAITDVARANPYWHVSVAGFPDDEDQSSWNLEDAIWTGVVTLVKAPGPGYMGTIQADSFELLTELANQEPGYGMGGSPNFLPFRNGTTAQYGILGVHDCGFGMNGWKAVDLFPTENMTYGTQPGEISYICRDAYQISIRVGNNMYVHLQNHGQAQGDQIGQGEAISGMVPGTHTASCGNTSQQENSYHVHFCFVPTSLGNWSADGYTINVLSGVWTKSDGSTVNPLGYLTAAWASGEGTLPIEGPTGGANFWDSMTGGLIGIISKVIPVLPQHKAMGIAERVLSVATVAVEVLYVIVLTNFDMTVPKWCLTIWFVLEAARIIYAGYMFIKKAIPVVG